MEKRVAKTKHKRSPVAPSRVSKQLQHLINQRHEIDNQIAELILSAIGSIDSSTGGASTSRLAPKEGLTALIRKVLRRSEWLSPINIRDALSDEGVDLYKYSNLLAEIHVILRRLEKSALVEVDKRVPRRSLYRWIRDATSPQVGRRGLRNP